MKKGIAFFDFDGTITTKDTMLELIRFHKGKAAFFAGFLALSPYMVAMKLKLISNTAAKEKMLAYFFKNMPVADFEKMSRLFNEKIIPALIRPGALETFETHKKNGVEIIIVSASARQWIQYWCEKNNLRLISSVLEEKNGLITGKLQGANCHGEEKVKRIKEMFNLGDYENIFCYGDTSGDKPMLALATQAHYKPFREGTGA